MDIQKGINNNILRQKSITVAYKEINKYKKIINLMKNEVKKTQNGKVILGIAAPQIGKNIRIIVIKEVTSGEVIKGKIYEMINPEIIEKSEEKNIDLEGCLSIPEIEGPVTRFNTIKVKYLSLKGKEYIKVFTGLNARVIQHEIDHLDGILFTDYL